jgi:hypothetical protein
MCVLRDRPLGEMLDELVHGRAVNPLGGLVKKGPVFTTHTPHGTARFVAVLTETRKPLALGEVTADRWIFIDGKPSVMVTGTLDCIANGTPDRAWLFAVDNWGGAVLLDRDGSSMREIPKLRVGDEVNFDNSICMDCAYPLPDWV